MKAQPKTGFGAFQKAAESIYRHSSSGAYYARFRHKGERIMQRLGKTHSPCTSLPEAKRLLKLLKSDLESTEVIARKKTLGQILKEFRAKVSGAEKTRANKNRQLDRMEKEFPLPLSTRVSEIQQNLPEAMLEIHHAAQSHSINRNEAQVKGYRGVRS